MDNFDPYNVLLVIATNIPVLLMTAFVLQGHKYDKDCMIFEHQSLNAKYLQYFHFSIIKYTLVYLYLDFSTTSAQFKCIKHKISFSNLVHFQYTSLVH